MASPPPLLATPAGRLRVLGFLEGASFLVLLAIAMPLKYLWGMPTAVQIAGWMHGLLFIGFCMALMETRQACGWRTGWTAVVLIAALLPFGPFVLDRRIRERSGQAS
jgi:integral membrane protein